MSDNNSVEKALRDYGKKLLGDVKILMIEDDAFFSSLILERLSKEGSIPYSAVNGDEALSLVEQYQPNLIILDLMLPGKPGEEVLVDLKSDEVAKKIPVIVFSNKSDSETIDYCLKNGASKYLVKSGTELSELPQIIHSVLPYKS